MNDYLKSYELWANDPYFDEATRAELRAIVGDEAEIEDRFYRNLSFGTAGLRGVLGAGTNRMNTYTVAQATEGFARYLDQSGEEAKRRGVVISYDSRLRSDEFALLAALVFAQHGIRVKLMDALRPTPMLSFALRYYHCIAGVMVTASHNPSKYNGYKAYGEDGGQLPPEAAAAVTAERDAIEDFRTLKWMSEEEALKSGLLDYIGEELDQAYMAELKSLSLRPEAIRAQKDLKIVYTPLHGCGNVPVRRILSEMGFEQVLVVPEQEKPDGYFSTVKSPNPEERSALELAIALAEREGADLVLATDPDADRTGVCLRNQKGEFEVLSGNQIGLLLLNYILKTKKSLGILKPKSFCVTTIVSTKLAKRMAAHYGVDYFECLTGFKWIADLIKQYDEQGDAHFQFGFEESFGYLSGTAVRDKDAVVACLLLAEMAAVAKQEGKSLVDELQEIYQQFSYAEERTYSIEREGIEGLKKMQAAMNHLRENGLSLFADLPLRRVKDVKRQTCLFVESGVQEALDLPSSDVLLYELEGSDFFCVRPSGTEPKIKIYFGCYRSTAEEARLAFEELSQTVLARIERLLD